MKKVFVFGNGSTIVDAKWGYLRLKSIKPPLNYLGTIKKGDLVNKEIILDVTLTRKLHEKLLKQMQLEISNMNEPCILEFGDLILDFTDFNIKSKNIILKGIKLALTHENQLALAC